MSKQQSRRTGAVWPPRIVWSWVLATVLSLIGLGCDRPAHVEPPEPSPLVRVASAEVPAFRMRLSELLAVAEVDVETGVIDFADLDDDIVRLGGWSPEPTLGMAWGTGDRSEVEFTVVPERDLTIRLRGAPFHFPGSKRQTVAVVVNGREIDQLRMWRFPRSYSVSVPGRALRLGVNRLELRYGYSARPKDVLDDTEDTRELAVRWDWIRFQSHDEPPTRPRSSTGGTRLELPFSTRVNYFFELASETSLRIAGLDVWGDGKVPTSPGMRLRIETEVDGGERRVVELTPSQVETPIEVALPVQADRERVRISLAAFQLGRRNPGAVGLSVDLPEIVGSRPMPATLADGGEDGRGAGAVMPAGRPNILIYLIDTLRADHLGVYGYPHPTSPNIDRFASDATVYARAVAQSPWTKPSVASLFTGLNPQVHGVNGRRDALSTEATTLAERLWESGYETGAIYTNGNIAQMGLGQGFKTYRHLREGRHDAIHVLSDRLNEEAFAWLDQRDPEKPFFLYLHSTDPHAPYTPPEGFLERAKQSVDDATAGLMPEVNRLGRYQGEERRDDLVALYDAEIAFNDHHFGRLLDELRRRGLYDSTLVVLLSDHGEEFFDHQWWQHGKTLYEEQLWVPLIVRFPGGERAGETVDRIAQQIDLYPTLLEAAGLEASSSLTGRSLLASRTDESSESPVHALSYLDLDGRVAESVTTANEKLILHHNDLGRGRLLFDLGSDRGEKVNLWSSRPVLAGYLRSALKAFSLAHQTRLAPEEGEIDDEMAERLRALGYLN